MKNSEPKSTDTQFKCEECGLHYRSQDLARQCQAWCGAHKESNPEITQFAIENELEKPS